MSKEKCTCGGYIEECSDNCETRKELNATNVIFENVLAKHKGLRFNQGKLRYDLLHTAAQEGLVRVLTKGAKKYADRNWEKGMTWTSVVASLKRHLAAFERGEDYDLESGELHIDHVQCNAHFLSAYYKIYPQGDDRVTPVMLDWKAGLDIDEVLCDWVTAWCDYRGIPVPDSWWFDRGIMDEFDRMRDAGELDDFYLSLQPHMKGIDIPFEPHCYITSRPVSTEVTEKWLAMHGFPAKPVFTTGVGKSKVQIAIEQGLDIFVDDAYHNYKALNDAGICCFLYDAPHNRRFDVGHKRISNLNELF